MSKELGGGMCDSGAANEVWSFGDEAYAILVRYIQLREKLRPYITKLMTAAHEKGTPPMRPLFYDFPSDKTVWEIEDEFMFGGHLLIAPVLYEKMTERKVYLPSGKTWIDVNRKMNFEGGQWITVPTPMADIPVFTDCQDMLDVFCD